MHEKITQNNNTQIDNQWVSFNSTTDLSFNLYDMKLYFATHMHK